MQQQPFNERLSRRRFGQFAASQFTSWFVASAGATMAFPLMSWAQQARSVKRPKILGTTFSQLQCHYIELDWQATFRSICGLGFDEVRLCAYWHEIEHTENEFDFSKIDWLLDECDRHGIKATVAVGMKVPRWPEFHFPNWLRDRYDTQTQTQALDQNAAIAAHALNFVHRVVDHCRTAPSLVCWQVENEPFTHLEIARGRYLSFEFVQTEIELVRSWAAVHQQVTTTGSIVLPAAQDPKEETALKKSLELVDAFGVNVYTKVPLRNTFFYLEPLPPFWETLERWQTEATQKGKEIWIAEAQAEPWEPNQLVALNKPNYPSSSPRRATNLVTTLVELGYDRVFLWGCEYWYWHLKHDRNHWWWAMQQIVEAKIV